MNTVTKKKTIKNELSGFYKDVIAGLTAEFKHLDSKYFYDKAGDKLFQQIMDSPEYYLTRAEMEIMQQQSDKLAKAVLKREQSFDLVELGAGDATKSIHFLRALLKEGADFCYYPIDISTNVISLLEDTLPEELPGLQMKGIAGEYFEGLKKINKGNRMKLVMFMGSTIGNMLPPDALAFCRELRNRLNAGDMVLIGYDLKKNPQTILAAYNDAAGVTKKFNINLLKRINRELGANFNTAKFIHYPTYDPQTGACKSFLVSTAKQEVNIGEVTISFEKDEPVYMEISQKYSVKEIEEMAMGAGFKPVHYYFDSKKGFTDVLWQCV
jgi:dimethylhistidine N-methyltransferase